MFSLKNFFKKVFVSFVEYSVVVCCLSYYDKMCLEDYFGFKSVSFVGLFRFVVIDICY